MASRQHHYLSQFYLKGFTNGESKKSKLTVLDLDQKKIFETNPRNVGGIRDFNRIKSENILPDAIENAYSDFEGKAAKSIKAISQGAPFEGENRNVILNLIALYAVRSPQKREELRKTHEDLAYRSFDLAFSTQERWDSIINKMKKSGYSFEQDISYHELKSFHERKGYKLKLDNAYNIVLEIEMIDPVLKTLANRNWMVLRCINNNHQFITTDSPVVLTWIKPKEIPSLYLNAIGFGLKDTRVFFPLTRNLLLMGEFEGKDCDISAGEELVARSNSILLQFAKRQIYASSIHFYFMGNNDNMLKGHQYLSFFAQLNKDHSN